MVIDGERVNIRERSNIQRLKDGFVTGINITRPEAPVVLTDSFIRGNRGYGIFVNSSSGDVLVKNTIVSDNGADGIRYVRFDPRLDDQFDRTDIYDFCMFPTTVSQTYPISMITEQAVFNPTEKECFKVADSCFLLT